MSSYPPPPPPPGPGVGHRIEEAMELIEMELRHAIGYVNDAVIPQVRSESISAMRKVSDTLRNLADRMEKAQQQRDCRAGCQLRAAVSGGGKHGRLWA
jgi:hypothetical protein